MAEHALESYSEFIDSLREVETLLATRPSTPLGSGTPDSHMRERELVNAITRACVVMLVAHFEGFVKAALTELIDEICRAKPPVRRLPEALLELHTRERIHEIFGTEGPERIDRTRRLFTTYAQLWDSGRIVNPQLLSAKVLTRQFTNAKPEVLEAVFSLLGVNDVIPQATVHVNGAIAAREDGAMSLKVDVKLTEIVERRNKIAHGDRAEKPTPVEVEGYMVFLRDLAQFVSTIVARRIEHCCSLR
jgi:hypothetical protein